MERETEEVVIVGGGIAGLATAVALKRVGVGSLVLERSDGLRANGGSSLTFFPNAWLALQALGVAHKLTTSAYPPLKKGYMTKISTGAVQEVSFTASDGSGFGPRSVHRRALLEALADELPRDAIRFSSKLNYIEAQKQDGSIISIVHLEDGSAVKAKVLIGCDGVHSVVARWLGLGKPVHAGRSGFRGIGVFPQGHGLKQEIRQFLDKGLRAGFIPITDTDVYWFLIYNFVIEGESITRDPEMMQREVIENLGKDLPEIYLDIVRHSNLSTLSWVPIMCRYPWDVIFGKLWKDTITIAGDAMHPMTPDLGQGGASALEDAVVLGRHIGQSVIKNGRIVPQEIKKAMQMYVKERRWRTAWLITGSYLTGWVQQDDSKWWIRFFRDYVFYKYLYSRMFDAVRYDCGKLPEVPSGELENSSKID